MYEKDINVSTAERAPPTPSPPQNDGFFSWIQDEEARGTPIKKTRTVPWLGTVALAGSALTAILSFVLLRVVDGRKIVPDAGVYKAMQPASWLSVLISANSIFLHIALTEGVTVAWWYKATRSSATIKDLHRVWATGTSASSAMKDIRGLNYVSLATIFVAIIPLNGFLLQGALSTPVHTLNNTEIIPIPMVKQLQQGYSVYTTDNGSGVGFYDTSSTWPQVFQQVQNSGASSYSQYAYFGNFCFEGDKFNRQLYNDTLDKKQATWKAKVPGAGFNYSCLESTRPFDMTPYNTSANYSHSIFSLNMIWNHSDPNTLYLDTLWKDTEGCAGAFKVRNCTLKAATVEYPVQVDLNVSGAVAGPYYSLQPNTDRHGDQVLHILDPYPNEGLGNTTFGGIWFLFEKWYGGWIQLSNYRADYGGRVQVEGPFANTLAPNYGYHLRSDVQNVCNMSIDWGLQSLSYFQAFNSPEEVLKAELRWFWWTKKNADVTDIVLEQIRQSMFLASVYSGSQWYTNNYVPTQQYHFDNGYPDSWWLPSTNVADYVQNVNATRFITTPVYEVRWYLWGSSLALTYMIILVVLPTFWGFWLLLRKPTMSPVDVARAFNAPVVTAEAAQHHVHVDRLLREVGSRNIHQPAIGQGSSLATVASAPN